MKPLDAEFAVRAGYAMAFIGVASLMLGLVIVLLWKKDDVNDRESRRLLRFMVGMIAFQTLAFVTPALVLTRTTNGRTLTEFLLLSSPPILVLVAWYVGLRYLIRSQGAKD